MKIQKIDYCQSEPIEKYGCLLGDLTLKVLYKDGDYAGDMILNFSFQYNKDYDASSHYSTPTFALTNDSLDRYVFENSGCFTKKAINKQLNSRMGRFFKKNDKINICKKGEVAAFLEFLHSSYKTAPVEKRAELFEDRR